MRGTASGRYRLRTNDIGSYGGVPSGCSPFIPARCERAHPDLWLIDSYPPNPINPHNSHANHPYRLWPAAEPRTLRADARPAFKLNVLGL